MTRSKSVQENSVGLASLSLGGISALLCSSPVFDRFRFTLGEHYNTASNPQHRITIGSLSALHSPANLQLFVPLSVLTGRTWYPKWQVHVNLLSDFARNTPLPVALPVALQSQAHSGQMVAVRPVTSPSINGQSHPARGPSGRKKPLEMTHQVALKLDMTHPSAMLNTGKEDWFERRDLENSGSWDSGMWRHGVV